MASTPGHQLLKALRLRTTHNCVDRLFPASFESLGEKRQLLLLLTTKSGLNIAEAGRAVGAPASEAENWNIEARRSLRAEVFSQAAPGERRLLHMHLPPEWVDEAILRMLDGVPHTTVASLDELTENRFARAHNDADNGARPALPNTKLRRLTYALLIIASAGLAGLVVTQWSTTSPEGPSPQVDLVPFSIQHVEALELTIRTSSHTEAETFILRQFDRRVAVPGIAGAALEGAGHLPVGRSVCAPILRYLDRATGAPVTVYAYSYALLDLAHPRVLLAPAVRRRLAASENRFSLKTNEYQIVIWRRNDDIMLALAPLDVEALEMRLER